MAREKDSKDTKEGRDEGKSRKRGMAEAAARRAALEAIAEQFKALGDPTRLAVVLYLKTRAAESGPATLPSPSPIGADADDEGDGAGGGKDIPPGSATVGEIGCHVFGTDKAASTLSHHLKELRRVGLVSMKRRGKNMLCRVAPEAIASLAAYLQAFPAVADAGYGPAGKGDDDGPGEHDGRDAEGAATTPL